MAIKTSQSVICSVVGCGAIGKRHVAVIDAEPEATLGELCDIETSKMQALTELYGDRPCFTDYNDFLRNTTADIIHICTPHSLHAEMSIKAAEAGKHVLVEKPMALNTADAERMIAAAKAHNTLLLVVKQNRYNVPIRLTKEALDQGRLGKVFLVDCRVLWNRHQGYYSESPWRGKKEHEGGALFTQASHFIDLLNWWFGDVVSAKATVATKNHDIDVEDCGNAIVEFTSGTTGNIMWTTCVYNKNYEGSITIVGEKGTIKIGGQYLNKIEYWDVESFPLQEGIQFADKPNAYGKYQGTSSNHDKVLKDVIAKLHRSDAPVVEGKEGMMSITAINKIYDSARNK